jgi:hypothetical protein
VTAHSPDRHLRDDLGYSERQLIVGHDCPRALLHVERCECGATTVRPYEQSVMDKMREEWGIVERVDEAVRERVLSLTYDPVEREDVASGEAWGDERALA